jgi:hypothetical protein
MFQESCSGREIRASAQALDQRNGPAVAFRGGSQLGHAGRRKWLRQNDGPSVQCRPRSTSSAMRLEMARRRDVARMKTNLMESAGCKSTSGLARGTFRTGERTFQCRRSMQVSPLPAQ